MDKGKKGVTASDCIWPKIVSDWGHCKPSEICISHCRNQNTALMYIIVMIRDLIYFTIRLSIKIYIGPLEVYISNIVSLHELKCGNWHFRYWTNKEKNL